LTFFTPTFPKKLYHKTKKKVKLFFIGLIGQLKMLRNGLLAGDFLTELEIHFIIICRNKMKMMVLYDEKSKDCD
jgi:hypothetical protein